MRQELTPKQELAIRLLALGEQKKTVAERLEVSRMTLLRWHKNPNFESQLSSITRSGLEATAKMLSAAGLTAAETVQELMCDLNQPPAIRLKAALGVLSTLPAITAALERSAYRPLDFDNKDRWGSLNTFNGRGELIDRGQAPAANRAAVQV